jgi:integrase
MAPPKKSSERTLTRLLGIAERGQWAEAKAKSVLSRNAEICIEFLGAGKLASEVTRTDLRELCEHLSDEGNSGGTINRKLSSLSVLMKIAEDEEWIERAPKFPRRKEAAHRVRFFDNEEEDAMIFQCSVGGYHSLADFIEFGIDTGFRKMEILGLELKDCKDGRAVLHAGATKSDKGRSVPLTQRAQEIVAKRQQQGFTTLFQDLTYTQLRYQWDNLRDSLGKKEDDGFIIHTLRHTCASRLAIQGQNAAFIMQWMGHSTITMTQRYMHLGAGLIGGTDQLDAYRKKAQQIPVPDLESYLKAA